MEVITLEFEKLSVLISEAVSIEDISDIIEYRLSEDINIFSESDILLSEADESRIASKIQGIIDTAKLQIKGRKVTPTYFKMIMSTLTVAVAAYITFNLKKRKEQEKEVAEPTLEESSLFWLFDEAISLKPKSPNTPIMLGLIFSLISVAVTYYTILITYANIKGDISVGIANSQLRKLQNTVKSAQSKDPELGDKYASLLEKLEEAVEKLTDITNAKNPEIEEIPEELK